MTLLQLKKTRAALREAVIVDENTHCGAVHGWDVDLRNAWRQIDLQIRCIENPTEYKRFRKGSICV